MITPRRVKYVCGVYLLAAAVSIVGAVIEAAARGGYHPELYVGRFDPVRAAVLVLTSPAPGVMALFAADAIVNWRRGPSAARVADVVMSIGLLIAVVGVVALFIWFPSVSGTIVAPQPILATIFVGSGLTLAGFLPLLGAAVIAAVRRRDRAVLVGLVGLAIFAAWIIFGIARRL